MKILHLCLCATLTEGWTYQDNLLPKYHAKAGHDVTVVTNEYIFDDKGQKVKSEKKTEYWDNGVKVVRLPEKGHHNKLKRYEGVSEILSDEKPDIIFSHSCQYMDTDVVAKYVKQHEGVTLYVDNHADYLNSATGFLSKNILHRIIWRNRARKLLPYAKKFYGVSPARVDFLRELYKIPEDRIELLVMGADDELVEEAARESEIEKNRHHYDVSQDDFVIVTGGKIDSGKKQIFSLLKAIQSIDNSRVKLIVFGPIVEEMKAEVLSYIDGKKISYYPWLDSRGSYGLFAIANLAIFLGGHSVYWEQVVGSGVPIMVRKMISSTHIDVGGNCIFLETGSDEEVKESIETLLNDNVKYDTMKKIAQEKGKTEFSYRDIARRSIDENARR